MPSCTFPFVLHPFAHSIDPFLLSRSITTRPWPLRLEYKTVPLMLLKSVPGPLRPSTLVHRRECARESCLRASLRPVFAPLIIRCK